MSGTLSDMRNGGLNVQRVAVGLIVLLTVVLGFSPISVSQVFAAGISQEIRGVEIDRAVMREDKNSLKVKHDRLDSRPNGNPENSPDFLGRPCWTDAEPHLGHGLSGCDQEWMLILLRW